MKMNGLEMNENQMNKKMATWWCQFNHFLLISNWFSMGIVAQVQSSRFIIYYVYYSVYFILFINFNLINLILTVDNNDNNYVILFIYNYYCYLIYYLLFIQLNSLLVWFILHWSFNLLEINS